MYSLALLAVSAFVLALVLTPLCRNLCRRLGVVDRPDGGRHAHAEPVPRMGGVPILAAYVASFGVLMGVGLAASGMVAEALPMARRVLPAAALVFAVGLVDDLRGLKPWQKFVGQAVAAVAAFWGGVEVTGVGGLVVPVWVSLPLTVVWLVGCSNAFNLIDGVDGLAAGAGLFATATMLVGALLNGNVALALATAPLLGALGGFLRYNFNPASIFMGDSGSLTVGFLLGCFGVVWGQKSATMLGMTAPLMALAVPLVDTAVAIGRRFLRRQPLFQGDAGHIHHRLLQQGLTPRRVALVLYGMCGLGAGLSLVSTMAHQEYKGVVILVFCGVAWIGVQHLGYVEFGEAGRMMLGGAFRKHLNSQLTLRAFEEAAGKAATAEQQWRAVCEACRKFGFARAELRVNGDRFEETLTEANGDAVWSVEIPVGEDGRLVLTRRFGEAEEATVLAPFAEALHRRLGGNGSARAKGHGAGA